MIDLLEIILWAKAERTFPRFVAWLHPNALHWMETIRCLYLEATSAALNDTEEAFARAAFMSAALRRDLFLPLAFSMRESR